MKQAAATIAFISMIYLAGSAYAEMYKWTDKDGVVHVSNTPTEFGDDAEVNVISESKSSPIEPESVAPPQIQPEPESENAPEGNIGSKDSAITDAEMENLASEHEEKMKELQSDLWRKEEALKESQRFKTPDGYHHQSEFFKQQHKERDREIKKRQKDVEKAKMAIERETDNYNMKKNQSTQLKKTDKH